MRRRLYPTPLLVGGRTVPALTPGATLTPNGRWLNPNRDPNRDTEAFCNTLLKEAFDEWGHFERPHEYDESLSLLIHRALRLEATYDPARSDSFADYARYILKRRAADVGPRRLLGRNGNRTPDYQHDPLDESTPRGQPGHALDPQPGDQDPDRGQASGRLQAERDRDRARSQRILGLTTTGRAA